MPPRLRDRRLWLPTGAVSSRQYAHPIDYIPEAYVCLYARDLVDQVGLTSGSPVSYWPNLGSVAGDPSSSGSARPSVSTALGFPSVLFVSASSQFLDFDIADLSQPFKMVAVVKTVSVGSVRRFLGRGSTATSHGVGMSAASEYSANYGSTLSGGTIDTNVHVVRATINNATSEIWADEVSVAGTGGTGAAGANAQLRLVIGAGFNAGTYGSFWDGHVMALVLAPTTVSDARMANLARALMVEYGIYNPLTAVPWLSVAWASDPSWVTGKPSGNLGLVSQIRNSGSFTGDPAQTNPSLQPRLDWYGINGRYGLLFDGAGTYLDANITDPTQPLRVLGCVKTRAVTPGVKQYWLGRGFTSTASGIGLSNGAWVQNWGTDVAGGTADTLAHAQRATLNGATSPVYIDGTQVATGDTGTAFPGRFDLGAGVAGNGVVSANFWNGWGGFWGIADGAVTTDADLANGPELYLRSYYRTP